MHWITRETQQPPPPIESRSSPQHFLIGHVANFSLPSVDLHLIFLINRAKEG